MFISKFSRYSIVTYVGVTSGVLGIFFATVDVRTSLVCLFLCAVFDFFDGRFARMFKRSEFEERCGIIIDSLADVFMFAALPTVILFNAIRPSIFAIIIAIIYVACGITRLVVFTAEASPNKKTTHYRGLPITFSGILIPMVYFLTSAFDSNALEISMLMTFTVLSLLFVLNIKIKKP